MEVVQHQIRKYIFILICATLLGYILAFLVQMVPEWLGIDFKQHFRIMSVAMPVVSLVVKLGIAMFVYRDWQKHRRDINYFILVLILVNEYAGVGFFLLTCFFETYTSTNISAYAKKD